MESENKNSFWENVKGAGPPRNPDEAKEKNLVDALHDYVKGEDAGTEILLGLLAHYETRLWRIRTFLDKMSDDTPFRDGCPLGPEDHCPLLEDEITEDTPVEEGGQMPSILDRDPAKKKSLKSK